MAVDDRKRALERLLCLAGRRPIDPADFPPRPTNATLPEHLQSAVMDAYHALGGVQDAPSLRPGPWDTGADDVMIELDEALHFNRYRKVTLALSVYDEVPGLDAVHYISLCDAFEERCLQEGKSQGRWTNPSTERQFGPAGQRGSLLGAGSPRWKQGAIYDVMKDLAPLSADVRVARLSVWDIVEVPTRGATTLDVLLRETPVDPAAAGPVAALVASRSGGR